jgi:hypothetical protein
VTDDLPKTPGFRSGSAAVEARYLAMTDLPQHSDTGEDLRAERIDALARMLSPEGPPDPSELAPPTYWPSLSREEAVEEWDYLRAWVERLLGRFGHLYPDVIPACWYRHPGHVEALAALAEFERTCFGHSALPTDAVRWHRAFRDIEDRLRAWTSTAGCTLAAGHKSPVPPPPNDEDDWAAFVAEETAIRPTSSL